MSKIYRNISIKYKQKRFAHINYITFTSNIILRRTPGVGNTAMQIKAFGVGQELTE